VQVLIAFLFVCFFVGGTTVGRPVRRHPIILLAFSSIVAASYYMLRVVLS
jgi:hypothetical protein